MNVCKNEIHTWGWRSFCFKVISLEYVQVETCTLDEKMLKTVRTLHVEESELYTTMFHECKFANQSNST